MIKQKLDPEIKIELLIKLAFGIPIKQLADEYELTVEKIINLRKNNYIQYNQFFDYWRIDKSVAVLGLTPKYERALSIVKKFYKSKIIIYETGSILYNNQVYTLDGVVELADKILQKDNILNFKDFPTYIKNHY